MHVIVDAMNVLGSRPDGWWRDRDAALRRLAAEVATWAGEVDASVVLVADGRPVDDLAAGRHDALEVRYADRSGPDAADDAIVALVAELAGSHAPSAADADRADTDAGGGAVALAVEVVTADRDLRERVTRLGATVTGPRGFLDRLAR